MLRQNYKTQFGTINYYFKKGEPLIVFLNGFGSFDTKQTFSPIIDKLPKDYGIFAADYLNSGFSGKSTKEYVIADEANELAQIINSFNAKYVIIVAHSIGGVYAFHMQKQIRNLKALIAIEPTTREIILNPPKDEVYIQKQKEVANVESRIREDIQKIFSEEDALQFWKTTEENCDKFDENTNKNAQQSLENDSFWKSEDRLSKDIISVIITEKYRKEEYERSEYLNSNPNSQLLPMGTYHYIQFEHPTEIAEIIIQLIDDIKGK